MDSAFLIDMAFTVLLRLLKDPFRAAKWSSAIAKVYNTIENVASVNSTLAAEIKRRQEGR